MRWLKPAEREKILRERNPQPAANANQSDAPTGLLALMRSRTIWGLAITQGCNVYTQYLFLTWLPSYLQTTKGLTIAKTGFYAALPYAIAVVLCIAIGRLSDRALRGEVARGGRRYVIAAAMVLASVILFAPLVDNLWVILALIALSLTGISATTSLNFALVNDLLPNPRDVGVAMAFNVVGGNVFGLMAPIVTGYVIEATGSYDNAFVIAGVLLLVGAASTLTLTRRPIGAAVQAPQGEARPA